MIFAGLGLLAAFLVFSSTALAQVQVTSQIIVTGRSLAVEPATNNFAAPGGVTTFLTTYDGSSGPILSPFSGEAKPEYLGSSNYVTDYEGRLGITDLSGTLVNYGELVMSNLPIGADADGDGLPDFLEKNLASSFSVDAADRADYRFDNNINNSEWTLSFSRSADSHAGTYTLRKKSDPNNPDKIWNGNFQLKGGAGTVSFDTMGRTFSMSTDSFDRQFPEANDGAGVYGVTADGKLLVSGFWLNSSFGPTRKIYINPFLVQRIGTTDRGRAVLYCSDGHAYDPADPGSTPYPDYTEFHLEVAGLSASLTQTPTTPSPLPWNDNFSLSASSNNYLDFRHSHFARLDVSGDKLNLVSSGYPYGENYGNLSIYSPPYLLLPLDTSWDLSVQVALPAPDGAYYKGVGISLAPENDTYDIANFGATVYSFELGQDDDPATPGTFLATYARKDWVEDQNLGQLTSVSFNTAFLRFSYNSSTKILSAYYDDNVSSPNRNWTFYQDLNVDPADPTSVAADLGLSSTSKIRMALWADAYVNAIIPPDEIWMDNLSIAQDQLEGVFAFNFPGARSTYGTDSFGDKIVGYYESYPDSLGQVEKHGFLFQGGNWIGLQPPESSRSEARGISGDGTIVGYFRDGYGVDRGYLFKNGSFTVVDYPSASKMRITGIDASDETRLVGFFTDSSGATFGFLKTSLGWTPLAYPGATETRAYAVAGSNVVGKYRLTADGPERGFLWNGSTWTSLGEGRLPYAVTSEGFVFGENLPPWTSLETATYFLYRMGSFQNIFLPGTITAIPYGFDPSSQTVTGFYLREDQSGWNGFTQSLALSSLPSPPPPLTNGLRVNLGQPFAYLPNFSGSWAGITGSNIPAGLSLNSNTGEITGSPSTAGYYRTILTASNAAGSATFIIPITIPATTMPLSFRDDFSSTVSNRYMPLYNLAAPSELVISNGSLRFVSIQSDSDGSLAAWIPNLPLPLTNSWDVVVDAKMPSGWDTPYAGVGLTLMPYEENGTVESTAMQRRLNLKLGRDTGDPIYAGNYFARAAYTNNEEYVFPPPGASLPFVTSNTPATQATLRYSFHAPTKMLSTWYRTNGATSWEQLGTPYGLDPGISGSLGHAWGLSNSSTLRVALWGDSYATNGSAGQAIELDNFYAAVRTGLLEPALPATLARRPHSPIYLSASPRDLGTYTYLWKKNGAPLQPLLGMTEHLATYYLPNPTTLDNGTYELTIFREDGEVYGTTQTVLTITPSAPEAPRSDDFSTSLGRWHGVWGFDLHDSYFKRSDDKLQLILDKSNGNNTQSFYIWDTPLPTDRSWEASVDANLASDIQLPSGQYIYHSLRLVADIPLNKDDGLSPLASGLSVEFAEDSDLSSGRSRYIQNVASTTNEPGYEILQSNDLDSWRRVVSLRIRYDSQTKTLSSFYALPFGLLSAPGTITLGPGPGSITLGPGLGTITSGPGTIVLGPGSGTLTLNSGSGTILTPTSASPPWSSPGLSGTTSISGTHSLSPASVTADGSGVASGDSLNISGGSIVISGDSVVVSGGSQSVSGGSLVISGGSLVISGGSLTLAPTWNLAATTNLSSLPPAQLTNGFRLMLSSLAEPSLVVQEGQAYFDNFTLKYDLTVSNAAVVTKSFDGSRSATITGTLVGVVAGDSVDHNGAGLFDTSEPGANKQVTASLSLTGPESAYYTITQPTGLTGTIQSLSEIFFGNLNPTNVASDGLSYLMKYAYGAADPTNPISQTLRPVTTLSTDTNGQPVLALTYYARTNDTNLTLQPVWNANLSAPAEDWASNVVVTTLGTITNTNGLVLERRQATVPVNSDSRKFLRLKTTLQQ